MIWFTADYHLGHRNIIKYCNRPFETAEEMNEYILFLLDKMTNPGDTLYYLGDLTFKEGLAKLFFDQFEDLEIHYLIGNHDNTKVIKVAREHCASVSQIKDVSIEGQSITLCHYAMRVWNKSHFNAWQLYGHSHGTLAPAGKQYDVGVDNNQFLPRSFGELKSIMDELPDNPNYIPPEKRR